MIHTLNSDTNCTVLLLFTMESPETGPSSWKHIGLHGHSVGTFSCTEGGIQWKSALYGRDDSTGTASTRIISKNNIEKASWTIFGKSGHMRIKITGKEGKSNLHEMRFDGFPTASFDNLKDIFQEKYGTELSKKKHQFSGNTVRGVKNIGEKFNVPSLSSRGCRRGR